MTTIARWRATWRSLGAATADPAEHAELLARYDEAHRHYHTRRHLDECFAHLDTAVQFAARAGEVELALWYHDAVYDPRRADNEAQSAELAIAALGRAGIETVVADRIATLILATRHVAPPTTPDAALLVDIDLGILAADEKRFDAYEKEVREEYAWVPAVLFRHKRLEVLQGFLDRERIYTSGRFPGWESRARANLARSIARI